uniref:F-box/LRR-repeat protein At5g02910-like n=1 Tax=Erigeron canadensis TaxID=72917 RepID=UPI001CB98BF2|nr:F-box/LRR-repeat protein At5g02910-like [Erigeron canadensis]
MDNGASMEQDRISDLPDDIIHHILSFLDMTYAVRTCILSRRWKDTWTSMSNIKLDCRKFKPKREFVEHMLTHRNDYMEVSEVELRFDRQTDHECVEKIMNYANLHNARKLTMRCVSRREFPYLFISSGTLKNFILEEDPRYSRYHMDYLRELAWDFPALETLRLRKTRLDDPETRVSIFSPSVST